MDTHLQFYIPFSKHLERQLSLNCHPLVNLDIDFTDKNNQIHCVSIKNLNKLLLVESSCHNQHTNEWFRFNSKLEKVPITNHTDSGSNSNRSTGVAKRRKQHHFDLSKYRKEFLCNTPFVGLTKSKKPNLILRVKVLEQLQKSTISIDLKLPPSSKIPASRSIFSPEVWLEIFEKMHFKDLIKARQVCQMFRNLIDKFCFKRVAFLVQTPAQISSLSKVNQTYEIESKSIKQQVYQHQIERKSLNHFFSDKHCFVGPIFPHHISHLHLEFNNRLNEAQLIDLSLLKNLKSLTVIGSAARFTNRSWARLYNLRKLRLIGTRMKFLIFICPNLIKLQCDERQINLLQLESMSDFDGQLPDLKSLRLDGGLDDDFVQIASKTFPNLTKLKCQESTIEPLANVVACTKLQHFKCRLSINSLRLRYLFAEVQTDFKVAFNKLKKAFDLNNLLFFVNGFRIINDETNVNRFLNYLKQDEQLLTSVAGSKDDLPGVRQHKLHNSTAISITSIENQQAFWFQFGKSTRELEIKGTIDSSFLNQIPNIWPYLTSIKLHPNATDWSESSQDNFDLQFLRKLHCLQSVSLVTNRFDYSSLIEAIRSNPLLTNVEIRPHSSLDRSILKKVHDSLIFQAKQNPNLRYTLQAPSLHLNSSRKRYPNLNFVNLLSMHN